MREKQAKTQKPNPQTKVAHTKQTDNDRPTTKQPTKLQMPAWGKALPKQHVWVFSPVVSQIYILKIDKQSKLQKVLWPQLSVWGFFPQGAKMLLPTEEIKDVIV